MAEIVIFGTGDIAQIANQYFEDDSPHKVVAFTVNKSFLTNNTFEGKPVVPFEEIEAKYPPNKFDMFIALSYSKMNSVREEKYNAAKKIGYKLVSYISPKCSYLSKYMPGDNCFIFEDNTIQPFVKIGNNVIMWSGNHIGHHSEIKDHNFISSHVVISGHCNIGQNCFLGVNATIRNGIALGEKTLVGAGAIIMSDTKNESVHLPAKSVVIDKKSTEITI